MELNEMAHEKQWIEEKCGELGKMFVEHFDKVWHDQSDELRHHHLGEMEGWYSTVNKFIFKHNKKQINARQLFDWFFMPNAVVATDLFPDENEALDYSTFIDTLVDEDMTTFEAWEELQTIKGKYSDWYS